MTHAIRESVLRIWAFFRKRPMDRDLHAELAAHIELATEEHMRQGMTAEEARRNALLAVGGVENAKELHRETRGLPLLDVTLQDLRYSFRTLRRDAGFTVFAILIVGLGVGASSTVFSVFNSLLLRPLPFTEPDRLVWIANGGKSGLSSQTVQAGHLVDFRAQNQSFQDVAAYSPFFKPGDVKLTNAGEPERLTGVPVTETFFPLLGIKPQLGRIFSAEECKWQGPPAVLLTDRLWRRRFASDPGVIGRSLTLDDQAVTVVGIMPASFDFGSVFAPGTRVDLFLPFPLSQETNRWGNTLALIGRLKPDADIRRGASEATVLAARLQSEHPDRNNFEPKITTLHDRVSGRFRPAMMVLACAVALLMLIVCANLSNLLLARTTARMKEIAIRSALGAGRRRLLRQMLTESVVLSSAGAIVGLLLASFGTGLLARLDSVGIPLLEQSRVDGGVLLFTLMLAVGTGLVFGIIPALQVSGLRPNSALKENSRGSTEGKRKAWLRGSLVVSEIALACILLVGAGLLIRSFLSVLDVDLGFRPESAVALRIDPAAHYRTIESRNTYFDEALRRVRSTPGVQAAGLTDALPLGSNRSWGIRAVGKLEERGKHHIAFVRIVTDGYLDSMGIALRAGREFTARDLPTSEPVILINETLARHLWPGEDPVGRMVHVGRERRVVGVVRDVRHLALEQEAGSEMYMPMRQTRDYSSVDLVVRGSRPAGELATATREALRPLDPTLPANQFRTIQELVDRSVAPRKLIVTLLGGFAAFALALASLGIYAVISYSVTQRTQEMGIRIALGASARHLQGRIVLQTLKLAAFGMVAGAIAAYTLARALKTLLYGVEFSDPVTFTAMVVVLTAVAALAGYLPARRVSRLDPMLALRAE